MSSRVEKYRPYVEQDIKKFGSCLKIVIGEYAQNESVFLLQNMFPILPEYIDHVHLVRSNPVPVSSRLQRTISRNFRELLRLHKRGFHIIFPDIKRLEQLMLDELAKDKSL
ncbi:MAG: hypothetical protein LBS96_09680 [Oscillospiraceae bacterium]|nr:hypothetical protein [Oscillospiraceae bacterium]